MTLADYVILVMRKNVPNDVSKDTPIFCYVPTTFKLCFDNFLR